LNEPLLSGSTSIGADSKGAVGEHLVVNEHGEARFDRVVLVLDPSRKSPWIALDFAAVDQQALAGLVTRQKAEFRARLQNRAWPAMEDQR
jgi:hypothetical protein